MCARVCVLQFVQMLKDLQLDLCLILALAQGVFLYTCERPQSSLSQRMTQNEKVWGKFMEESLVFHRECADFLWKLIFVLPWKNLPEYMP